MNRRHLLKVKEEPEIEYEQETIRGSTNQKEIIQESAPDTTIRYN